jgi:hypothetical protein
MAVSPRKDGLDADQLGALRTLAGSTTGCTVTVMMEHGFKLDMLTEGREQRARESDAGDITGWQAADRGDMADDYCRGAQGARRKIGMVNGGGRPSSLLVGKIRFPVRA